jgi:hypothetical protein
MFENKEKHPSYGLISFSRISCTGFKRMFGSSIDNHPTYIRLEVKSACIYDEDRRDYYSAEKLLIRADLSQTQFAELLTTMNMGEGVPCTFSFLDGRGQIEDPPARVTQVEKSKLQVENALGSILENLEEMRSSILDTLNKKTISKKVRDDIEFAIRIARNKISSNPSFSIQELRRRVGEVVTEAKAEVDAFVTHVVTKTGLEALKSMKLLGAGGPVFEVDRDGCE